MIDLLAVMCNKSDVSICAFFVCRIVIQGELFIHKENMHAHGSSCKSDFEKCWYALTKYYEAFVISGLVRNFQAYV